MRALLWIFLIVGFLAACGAPPGPPVQPERSPWYQRQGRHPVDRGETIGKVGLLNAWAVPCGVAPLDRSELIVHATAALGDNTSRLVAQITVEMEKEGNPTGAVFCDAVRRHHARAARLLDEGGPPAALTAVPTVQQAQRLRMTANAAAVLPFCPGGMPERTAFRAAAIASAAAESGADFELLAGVFDARAAQTLDRPPADLCDSFARIARYVLHGIPVSRPLGGAPAARPVDPPAPAQPKAPEPKRLLPGQSTPQLDI